MSVQHVCLIYLAHYLLLSPCSLIVLLWHFWSPSDIHSHLKKIIIKVLW